MTTAVGAVSVRYFAAAAEAAGVDTETVPAGTAALVVAELTRRHPDLAAVLSRCALLADGTRVERDDEVRAGVTLDVLPPFAGG
nr:MoaD/ThiS family protein [Cellulomonas sp. H30R-01]